MKSRRVVVAVVALAVAFLAGGAVLAQRASIAPARWDDDNLATLEGTITEVTRPFATFEADGERYTLHLGPYRFWERRGYLLEAGDRVTIEGQVSRGGSTVHLYPHRIIRGPATYALADDAGRPLWSRARHGRGAITEGSVAGPWHHRHGRGDGGRGTGSRGTCPRGRG